LNALRQAELQAEANRARLVRLNVGTGVRLMDGGDLFGALPYLAEALRLDREKGLPERVHRVRLGTLLRQCPRLVDLWFHDGALTTAEFSSDGRRVLTATADVTAQVWDAGTGEPVGKRLE